MTGTYDGWLVLLSIVVAIMASYVALDMASRVTASQWRKAARYWLVGGAISMGTGIWSMHFIGMLAFRMPIPMSYDIPITLLSLLIAVVISGFALYVASRDTLDVRRLLGGGPMMGAGIASMHYAGMAAMQVEPPIRYHPYLVGLSLLVATAASLISLWSAFNFRMDTLLSAFWKKAGSASVMGIGIAGMHYIGMAAAIFAPNTAPTMTSEGVNIFWLGSALGVATLLILAASLLVSSFDAYLAALSNRHAEALRLAHGELETRVRERTAELARTGRRLRQALDERERLARDLHDNIVQRIYAIGMRLEESQQLIRDSPQEAAGQIEGAIGSLNDVIRDVRQYIAGPGLRELGAEQLGHELAELVTTVEPAEGPRFRLSVDPDAAERLRPDEAENLLQIAREAVSNAIRHSQGQRGQLVLRREGDDIVLEVSDDGKGYDPRVVGQRKGGLSNLELRARQIGASLDTLTAAGEGTRIILRIPREDKDHDVE